MGAAAGPAIALRDVSKSFGAVQALAGVSAPVGSGRLTGLVGPDGAGKTTLMRLMAGLLAPSAGEVEVAGLDPVRDARALAHRVGYMPQRFGLYEDLSVEENLVLYARLRGMEASVSAPTFRRLLEFTRLGPFTARLAGRLSGGMKQKLGLACALMASPEVLLLDEPGVGVDPVSRLDLWRMVDALTGEGMAVVWATAYLDEAARCDEVILLTEGRLRYAGPPGELTKRLDGRCYRLEVPAAKRRAVLRAALSLPTVSDGVIEGEALRIVTARAGEGQRALGRLNDAVPQAAPPRFEDAFIDLLGGGPGGHSRIAERMPRLRLDSEVAVECRGLTRRFGRFLAADDVSFAVERGQVFGLLGPNGAGKSTTFRMLCGLLKPSAGEARVVGLDLRHAGSAAKRQLGYMAQKFSLYGLLSVRQNLEFSAGVYGLEGGEKRRRIEEMVESFELGRFLSMAPEALPLGYRQRLALACALMHRPAVLFLDEPTSGVDPVTRREFWTHINGLAERGVTVMVTTHFMDEAEYCDRIALMYQARLIALDTPDGLKRQAAEAPDERPDMEAAFIRLIERVDSGTERAA